MRISVGYWYCQQIVGIFVGYSQQTVGKGTVSRQWEYLLVLSADSGQLYCQQTVGISVGYWYCQQPVGISIGTVSRQWTIVLSAASGNICWVLSADSGQVYCQ